MMDREDVAPAGLVRRRAQVDFARLAQAFRAKQARQAARKAVPAVPAQAGVPCRFCGVNNAVMACAHFTQAEQQSGGHIKHGNTGMPRLLRKRLGGALR